MTSSGSRSPHPRLAALTALTLATTLATLSSHPQGVLAFLPPKSANVQTKPSAAAARFVHLRHLRLAGKDDDSWDSPEDYEDFGKKDDDTGDDFPLAEPNLGIDIGAMLEPLSESDAAALRAEGREAIEAAFKDRLDEIEDLKKSVAKDFEKSREAMAFASDLRAKQEQEKLMGRIDSITNKFLESNKDLREGTKLAAEADRKMGESGQGLEVGSWGVDRYGRVVVTSASAAGGLGLLGGVSANVAKTMKDSEKEGEDGAPTAKVETESKIIILTDDSQDPSAKKILDRFATLLSDAFDSSITIDRVSTSSPAPLGGNNAQCAILVASTINDKSAADTVLDRILRRTAGAGGSIGVPPTHLVCISSLGTERTDKFPYSMQNLMGGKLDKRRDIEEAVINTVKRRMPEVQVPIDYTIFKVGEAVDDAKAKGPIEIMPGDVLDGEVGIEAAARALVQAVAFQPAARNATMCVAGGLTTELSDKAWDDAFLRLDGPELLRIDDLAGPAGDKAELDRRHDRLVEFVREWSEMFEGGAKGTGLTTPVMVRPAHRDASEAEGTVRRSGVRILFKQTNTGAAYKSKDEERAFEKEGPPNASGAPAAAPSKRKATKEGGIEVLVEETTGGDLRVRARRCNMEDSTVVKEMSEATILKQLRKAVDVWMKDHL